jgi:asparagine synthase (glutamine-hydrolysing)
MSLSLEGREPLLDYRLVEFVTQLDPNLKINNGEQKYILKEIVHKYLPREIMARPKMGFNIPITDWLSGDIIKFLDHYLDPQYLLKQGLFNINEITKLKKKYFSGHKYLANKLWVILIFQLWYDRWM